MRSIGRLPEVAGSLVLLVSYNVVHVVSVRCRAGTIVVILFGVGILETSNLYLRTTGSHRRMISLLLAGHEPWSVLDIALAAGEIGNALLVSNTGSSSGRPVPSY